jgi:hypothetical protein
MARRKVMNLRGETCDGISFVYHPRANQGIWYTTKDDSVSVGLFGPTILKALSEMAAETGRF